MKTLYKLFIQNKDGSETLSHVFKSKRQALAVLAKKNKLNKALGRHQLVYREEA